MEDRFKLFSETERKLIYRALYWYRSEKQANFEEVQSMLILQNEAFEDPRSSQLFAAFMSGNLEGEANENR